MRRPLPREKTGKDDRLLDNREVTIEQGIFRDQTRQLFAGRIGLAVETAEREVGGELATLLGEAQVAMQGIFNHGVQLRQLPLSLIDTQPDRPRLADPRKRPQAAEDNLKGLDLPGSIRDYAADFRGLGLRHVAQELER